MAGKKGKSSLDMDENVEALLTYVLGWVTGIVFLILEKENKFVRFHAMQSLITFASLMVLAWILAIIPYIGFLLTLLVDILALVLWIVLMVKAYNGEKYKLPIVGEIAERQV